MHNDTLAVTAGRKRGRPAGSDSEQTRRTILAAARDTIAERGYRAATFQHIAQRAGVSRPTLHYYFDTREELYDTLLADVCAQVRRCAEVAVEEGSLRRKLAAFTSELGRLGAEEPAMMKLVVTARIDHHRAQYRHDAAAEIVATVHRFYDAAVADAARDGELPAGTDPRAVADMLSALFWGLGFHAGFLTSGTPAHNAPEVARQLLALLDGGLLSGSPGTPAAT